MRGIFNILEMAFCRAFQSLPGSVLKEYWGTRSEAGQGFANVGLNIIPPLLQSSRMKESTKLPFLVKSSLSRDPEVTQWFGTRGAYKSHEKQSIAKAKEPSEPHYLQAFFQATMTIPVPLNHTVFALETAMVDRDASIPGIISEMSVTWKESLGRPVSLALPFGLPTARLAFVLDFGLVTNEHNDVGQTCSSSVELPWGFRDQGFTEKTVMVWTVSLRQYSSMNASEVAELQAPPREKLLSECQRRMVQLGASRVIFLCGPNARRIVLAGIKPPSKIHKLKLELSNCRYEMYLELSDGSFPRLYVFCPELTRTVMLANWATLRRMDMIIRFAVILTGTQEVGTRSFERSGMLGQLLRQAQDEIRGAEKLTPETMNSGLKAWLYRKGVTQDTDIKKIEVAAGSVTRGLLMLLHVLPRRPREAWADEDPERVSKPALPRSQRSHHRPFGAQEFSEVEQIYKEAKKAHDMGAKDRLLTRETAKSDVAPKEFDARECTEVGEVYKKGKESLNKEIQDRFMTGDTANSDITPKEKITDDTRCASSLSRHPHVQQLEKDLPGNPDRVAFQSLIDDNPSWNADYSVDLGRLSNLEISENFMAALFNGNLRPDHDDDDLEERVEIVHTSSDYNVRQTAASGISRATTRLAGETKFRWNPASIAKAEWETKHKLAGYTVRSPDVQHGGGPVVTLCYMQIFFDKSMDFGGKYLTLHPEFVEEGKKHKHVWATLAPKTDPAHRMGIRACGTRKNGEPFDVYLERGTNNAVKTANAFADRILEGLDTHEFKSWPRRWVPRERESRKAARLERWKVASVAPKDSGT